MDENKQVYNSIAELAKDVGVTRKTLYSRARSHGIALNGEYTEQELKLLKSRLDKSNTTQTGIQNKQVYTTEINALKAHIDSLSYSNKRLEKELDTERERHDKQLSELNKHLDQAQQLQLIAEQRLNEEHTQLVELKESKQQAEQKKGFWARIFGT